MAKAVSQSFLCGAAFFVRKVHTHYLACLPAYVLSSPPFPLLFAEFSVQKGLTREGACQYTNLKLE